MDEPLRHSNRTIKIDQTFPQDQIGGKFSNFQFLRLVAINRSFVDCDFRYSEFDAAYLRKCTFDSCDFTGCKFKGSNLSGTKFIGCTFDYVQFDHTFVDSEILDHGCPGMENLRKGFARTLQLNFRQIGDTDAANKAISIELDATRIHLYKAWHSKESYYRKKYTGFRRVRMFFSWSNFIFLDFFWGNGESLTKLFRSLIIFTAIIAIIDVMTLGHERQTSDYLNALSRAVQILLGTSVPGEFPGEFVAAIALVRYIMIACIVAVFIKRRSRR